jgi:hypothetical protein
MPKANYDSHQRESGSITPPCKINGLRAHNQAKQAFSFSLLFSLLLFEKLNTLLFPYFIGDL